MIIDVIIKALNTVQDIAKELNENGVDEANEELQKLIEVLNELTN